MLLLALVAMWGSSFMFNRIAVSGLPPLTVSASRTADANTPQDPVERLRQLISERQAESVEILRSWMDEREETR